MDLSRKTLELAALALADLSAGDEDSQRENERALHEVEDALRGESQHDLDEPENLRLTRLQALADRALEIHSETTSQALESGDVPRYACVTSEGSAESTYADNPDVTVWENLDELGKYIAGTLEEGWPPQEVIDLETGADVNYTVTVSFPEENS